METSVEKSLPLSIKSILPSPVQIIGNHTIQYRYLCFFGQGDRRKLSITIIPEIA
jgi:hypothetical protein